jgi:redox-regulated HSP33 family molecular chaperone
MNNLLKTSALTLAALVGVASITAPALADSLKFDSGYLLTQLHYDGVNAIAADQVTDSTFRATVQLANGGQVFEFFDIDSLQQIK